MTYDELKEMGFSHEAIIAQGIQPEGQVFTLSEIAETWKIALCMVKKKIQFTDEQIKWLKEAKCWYNQNSKYDLPSIKGI